MTAGSAAPCYYGNVQRASHPCRAGTDGAASPRGGTPVSDTAIRCPYCDHVLAERFAVVGVSRFKTRDGHRELTYHPISARCDRCGGLWFAPPVAGELTPAMALYYASLVDSAHDAITGWTLDGTITLWNPAAERLYGYTAAEAIGKPLTIILPADRPDELPTLVERLAQGDRLQPYETVRCRKDGTCILVSLSLSPIRDVRGRLIGASVITRPVADRAA